MTKRDSFVVLDSIIDASALENKEEMHEFLRRQIEQLDNKKSAKSKKSDELLAVEKDTVLQAMMTFDHPVQVKEIVAEIGDMIHYSSQRVTSILKKLVDDKRVVNTKDKKTSLFSIVE